MRGRSRADDAQRRAVAGRRQSARVAVREDAVAGLEQRGAVLADAQAAVESSSWMACARASSAAAMAAGVAPGAASAVPQTRCISSSAQGRLTAVGRVASRPFAACSSAARNAAGSSGLAAAASAAASAMPMAAVTPMAGAPRTVMSQMRSATSCQVRQRDVALLLRQRELVDEHDLAGQDVDGAHAQARTAGPAVLRQVTHRDTLRLRCPCPRRRGTWPAPR